MKTFMTCIFLLGASVAASAQLDEDFKLPKAWEKDFTIALSYYGSMSGGSTDIKFTFDSCRYVSSSHDKGRKTKTYLLQDADRVAILKKLHELKMDKVKSASSVKAVNDGWSQSICFGFHCVDGGTSSEMTESDKNQFLTAYRYLEDFAIKKSR